MLPRRATTQERDAGGGAMVATPNTARDTTSSRRATTASISAATPATADTEPACGPPVSCCTALRLAADAHQQAAARRRRLEKERATFGEQMKKQTKGIKRMGSSVAMEWRMTLLFGIYSSSKYLFIYNYKRFAICKRDNILLKKIRL